MQPIDIIDKALALIEYYDGDVSDFDLPLADSLQDKIGLNMSLVTEKLIDRNWDIAGYEQKPGYRIYRFTEST